MIVRVISSTNVKVGYARIFVVRPEVSRGRVVFLNPILPAVPQPDMYAPDLFLVASDSENLSFKGLRSQRLQVIGDLSQFFRDSNIVYNAYLLPRNSDASFRSGVFKDKQELGSNDFGITKKDNAMFHQWIWSLEPKCPRSDVMVLDKAKEFKLDGDKDAESLFLWMLGVYLSNDIWFIMGGPGYWFHSLASIALGLSRVSYSKSSRTAVFFQDLKLPYIFSELFTWREIAEYSRSLLRRICLSEKALFGFSKWNLDINEMTFSFRVDSSSRVCKIDLESEEQSGKLPRGFCNALRAGLEEVKASRDSLEEAFKQIFEELFEQHSKK